MYIYVDESGTFVHTNTPNSWSVIAAFAIPERHQEKLERLVSALRLEVRGGEEVKLKDLSEARYIRFLRDLSRIGGLAFAAAGDASNMPPDLVGFHREQQAKAVVRYLDKMQHQSMRNELTELSRTIATMPLQLYTQMQLQITLFHRVVGRSSLYYAQYEPPALEYFRWRIDQKDINKSEYERTLEVVLAPAMQTKSMREPMLMLKEADYSYFSRFEFAPGNEPTYLTTEYGLEAKDGFDARKVLREDFALVDSNSCPGVQAADLLASGIRRALRGGFERLHEVSLLIGANMVSGLKGESAVDLLTLGETRAVDNATASVIKTMDRQRKPLLA